MSKILLNSFFLLLAVNVCARSRESGNEPASGSSTPLACDVSTDADAVLRRLSDFYRQAATLQVRSEQVVQVTTPGSTNRVRTCSTIAAARPNRLSIRSQEGTSVRELVSDGNTLTASIPATHHFTEAQAPDSFESLLQDPLAMRSAQFVLHLLADQPYETLMNGVVGTAYVGRERLDGMDVHHLHVVQNDITWDAWVQAHGDPLLMRISVDMSGQAASAGATNVTATETFHDWRINAPLEDQSFTLLHSTVPVRVAAI